MNTNTVSLFWLSPTYTVLLTNAHTRRLKTVINAAFIWVCFLQFARKWTITFISHWLYPECCRYIIKNILTTWHQDALLFQGTGWQTHWLQNKKQKKNKTQKLHKVPLTEHAGLHSITGFTGNCTQVWLQTNYYVSVIISASTAASKSEGRVLQRTQTLNWDPTRVLNSVWECPCRVIWATCRLLTQLAFMWVGEPRCDWLLSCLGRELRTPTVCGW